MMPQQSTCIKLMTRWHHAQPKRVKDELVVEEPLEVRVKPNESHRRHAHPWTRL